MSILLDFPDLQRVLTLRGAARRNIERLIEKYRDHEGDPIADGIYEYPEPAWNLKLCKALALMAYLEAKLDGVDEPNAKAILKFATDADAELQAAEKKLAPPAPPALPEGAPAGAPMPGGPAPDVMPQVLPPDQPLAPENAMAPEAMPILPGGP